MRAKLIKESHEEIRQELIDALQNHDWYYEMSDDHRKYLEGEREIKKIYVLLKQLSEEDARTLWNEYAPEMPYPDNLFPFPEHLFKEYNKIYREETSKDIEYPIGSSVLIDTDGGPKDRLKGTIEDIDEKGGEIYYKVRIKDVFMSYNRDMIGKTIKVPEYKITGTRN
ncbi:MAG: hypothetical protein ACOC1K_01350 [Nanoarchaeota archaeon]